MPTLDLKLDVSRIRAEQRAKEEKKRNEEELQRLQTHMQLKKRSTLKSNPKIVIDKTFPEIVLQPLTSGTSPSRQQRPLSKQERTLISQHGFFSETLRESGLLPKRTASGASTIVKDNLTQLRLLMKNIFQHTSANKKLQQQEAALQKALQQHAAAQEKERKHSCRF